MNLDSLLQLTLNASKKAARAILREKAQLQIWQKNDGSPLSSADLVANEILCDELAKSDIAICSEEKPLEYEKRKDLNAFWLIDPLDGTKSFIKGSDEYCILVALIAGKRPVLSLITKPSTGENYYAHEKSVVYKDDKALCVDESTFEAHKNLALTSVHHPNEKNAEFFSKNALTPVKISSALKFIALLEGKAGVYHRFENLHSWDIAAGDFLVGQSGGFMGDLQGKLLSYNEQSFLCPSFLAVSRRKFTGKIIF